VPKKKRKKRKKREKEKKAKIKTDGHWRARGAMGPAFKNPRKCTGAKCIHKKLSAHFMALYITIIS